MSLAVVNNIISNPGHLPGVPYDILIVTYYQDEYSRVFEIDSRPGVYRSGDVVRVLPTLGWSDELLHLEILGRATLLDRIQLKKHLLVRRIKQHIN